MGDLFCLCNAFETDLRFRSMMRAANNKFTDFTTLKLMCSLAQLFSIERCIKSLIKRTSMIKEGLFFLTCDERRSPRWCSESSWQEMGREGVASGRNVACQSLITCYIPGQIVSAAAPSPQPTNGHEPMAGTYSRSAMVTTPYGAEHSRHALAFEGAVAMQLRLVRRRLSQQDALRMRAVWGEGARA